MRTSVEVTEARGDPFRSVFEAELDFVVATLRRLGVAQRDLEDVTHETFLRVFRHWEEYDATRPVRPWLFLFAMRQASDYRRLARHRREQLGDAEAEGDALASGSDRKGADDLLAERDERAIVEAALREISFDQRVVVLLHDLQETPMSQVASMLAIPLQTAYSRLRVGREELIRAARRRVVRGAS